MVRIWCVPIEKLDRQHLLGEHGEMHLIFNAIQRGGGGWFNHPQTNRFKNHLGMLVDRHNQQISEMLRRGYHHKSPLPSLKSEVYTYSKKEMERDLKVLEERQK